MRRWILLFVAGCGPRCPGTEPDETPHEAIVLRREHRAVELVVPACLPVDVDVAFDGVPIACASEAADGMPLGPPLACWQLDPTTGRIWPRPPHLLAGRSTIMPIESGRVGGLVVGPASWQVELDDSRFVLAISTDRKHAVISSLWGGIDLLVYDLATGALVQRITSDEHDDGITGLAYVDDQIYRAGMDAAWLNPGRPHLAVWRDDGERVPVEQPADFDGRIAVVTPHAIALSRTIEVTTPAARPDDPRYALEGELLHSDHGSVLLPFCETRR